MNRTRRYFALVTSGWKQTDFLWNRTVCLWIRRRLTLAERILRKEWAPYNCCYKINYAIAINACIRFFYSTHADFSALEKLIVRNKCLSDPIVFLKEKLVIILPSDSITDYHNSFLLLLTFSLLIQKPWFLVLNLLTIIVKIAIIYLWIKIKYISFLWMREGIVWITY